MDSDWIVKIEFKNKQLETVIEKEYTFDQYTRLISSELMSVITDVENAFYTFEGGKQKNDWSEESTKKFNEIKHKLLDHANSVRRLPFTLSYKGINASAVSVGQAIANTINSGLMD